MLVKACIDDLQIFTSVFNDNQLVLLSVTHQYISLIIFKCKKIQEIPIKIWNFRRQKKEIKQKEEFNQIMSMYRGLSPELSIRRNPYSATMYCVRFLRRSRLLYQANSYAQ